MQEIEYGNILLKCYSSRFSGEIIVTVVKDCRLGPMSI